MHSTESSNFFKSFSPTIICKVLCYCSFYRAISRSVEQMTNLKHSKQDHLHRKTFLNHQKFVINTLWNIPKKTHKNPEKFHNLWMRPWKIFFIMQKNSLKILLSTHRSWFWLKLPKISDSEETAAGLIKFLYFYRGNDFYISENFLCRCWNGETEGKKEK